MIRVAAPPTRMRFTRSDYYRMAETGIIPPGKRVELLDGEVIQMSPIGSNHSSVVAVLDRFFQARLADQALCRVQSPLVLDDRSEPEPDLLLARPRDDFYRSAHPAPADVLLLIEVADSSAKLDLGDKRKLYANAGIADYWVVDLTRSILIVHRDPVGDRYTSTQEHNPSSHVSPAAFADVSVDVSQVFPG